MQNNSTKKTYRSTERKKYCTNRLKRIEGQVRGIINMIEDDRYCDEILIQLAAISSSIKSFASFIIEQHIKTCLKEKILNGNDEAFDEIVNLFKIIQ